MLIYLSRVADGGMDLGLGVREMAADREATIARAPAILTARVMVSVLLALVLGAIALVALPHPDGAVLAVFGLTLIPVGASSRWIYLGLEKTRAVAVARTIGEALMVLLVLVFVRGQQDLLVAPFAQFIGDSLAALLLLWWLVRRGIRLRVTFAWAAIRPLTRRAWPLVVSAMLGLLIYNSDLIFLRFFRGREEVGLYAAAYTLVSFLLNMGIAYSLSLLPTLTRTAAISSDHHGLYHTATAHVFAVGFPIALGGSLLAAQIIKVVFGTGYGDSVAALRVLMWAIPVSLLRDVPVIALMAWGREDRILRLTALAAVLNIALNLVLIPRYGLMGAAVATVATESVRMVVALVVVRALGFKLTTLGRFWRTLVAGAIMAGLLIVASPSALWLAVILGASGYLLSLTMLGGVAVRRGAFPSLKV